MDERVEGSKELDRFGFTTTLGHRILIHVFMLMFGTSISMSLILCLRVTKPSLMQRTFLVFLTRKSRCAMYVFVERYKSSAKG